MPSNTASSILSSEVAARVGEAALASAITWPSHSPHRCGSSPDGFGIGGELAAAIIERDLGIVARSGRLQHGEFGIELGKARRGGEGKNSARHRLDVQIGDLVEPASEQPPVGSAGNGWRSVQAPSKITPRTRPPVPVQLPDATTSASRNPPILAATRPLSRQLWPKVSGCCCRHAKSAPSGDQPRRGRGRPHGWGAPRVLSSSIRNSSRPPIASASTSRTVAASPSRKTRP